MLFFMDISARQERLENVHDEAESLVTSRAGGGNRKTFP